MTTPLCYTVIIPFFIALFLVGWIHPKLVKIALLKNIVDNPDARKLQRTPVPVLGGVAVFFGVVIAIGCMSAVVDCSGLPVVIMAMMAMLYTGTMDDILNLSPSLRLLIEIVVVLLLVFVAALFLRTRRLKRTLEEREGQLVVAREKAEESDMLKSAFLANMSHEIRTPLNAIVGFSSLMQGEELSQEERAEYCAIVVNNSEMLLTLLNDILDISSLECGKIKFNYSSEEIVQVCQHVLMTTAHTRQEGVEGRLECAVGSYMLVTDVHRLSQILINLLTNAGKFTSQGSITLGVEIDEAHREVLFSVADTGPGIPLDKQEMVFNRFEKLDGNKKKGTGLGLAICRQIAMIFGGRIWVDPTYTAGARFVFAHPIDIRFPEDGENRGGVSPLEAPGSSR